MESIGPPMARAFRELAPGMPARISIRERSGQRRRVRAGISHDSADSSINGSRYGCGFPATEHTRSVVRPGCVAAAGTIFDRHYGLLLVIRTLPETVAGATGQREYERRGHPSASRSRCKLASLRKPPFKFCRSRSEGTSFDEELAQSEQLQSRLPEATSNSDVQDVWPIAAQRASAAFGHSADSLCFGVQICRPIDTPALAGQIMPAVGRFRGPAPSDRQIAVE
jgi:hypothetical protein